jgi:hypothetical protein
LNHAGLLYCVNFCEFARRRIKSMYARASMSEQGNFVGYDLIRLIDPRRVINLRQEVCNLG